MSYGSGGCLSVKLRPMSALSDFAEATVEGLLGEATPDIEVSIPATNLVVKLTGVDLEIWDSDVLAFGGLFNHTDSVNGLQWGRGYHGLRLEKCDSGDWELRHAGICGRGADPEDAITAVFAP